MRFGIWGDTPYTDRELQAQAPLIEQLNDDDLDLAIFVGDIFGSFCEDSRYADAMRRFNTVDAPLVLQPIQVERQRPEYPENSAVEDWLDPVRRAQRDGQQQQPSAATVSAGQKAFRKPFRLRHPLAPPATPVGVPSPPHWSAFPFGESSWAFPVAGADHA